MSKNTSIIVSNPWKKDQQSMNKLQKNYRKDSFYDLVGEAQKAGMLNIWSLGGHRTENLSRKISKISNLWLLSAGTLIARECKVMEVLLQHEISVQLINSHWYYSIQKAIKRHSIQLSWSMIGNDLYNITTSAVCKIAIGIVNLLDSSKRQKHHYPVQCCFQAYGP